MGGAKTDDASALLLPQGRLNSIPGRTIHMTLILIGTLAFAISFVYCSFFEWTLHKYIMHNDRFMKYPYQAHQLEHHDIFKADATYFVKDEKDLDHVTFAWWNAPLLFGLHLPILTVVFLWVGGPVAAISALAALVSYYALYEYLHYCMHVPGDRWLERTRFFHFVQLHHRLHHVFYLKNLNVVVPIADFVLRTRVKMPESDFFEKIERARLRKLERAKAKADEPVLAESAAQLEHVS